MLTTNFWKWCVYSSKLELSTWMQERCEGAEKKRTLSKFRAPVVCVLGHVDTGKLRGTNVRAAKLAVSRSRLVPPTFPSRLFEKRPRWSRRSKIWFWKFPAWWLSTHPVSNLSSTWWEASSDLRCPAFSWKNEVFTSVLISVHFKRLSSLPFQVSSPFQVPSLQAFLVRTCSSRNVKILLWADS